jgi:phosphate-selective porin OprO/OprP
MRKATLVAALLLLTPAVSQAKTLEDLLVEKGVITKGEAAGASDSSASKLYWNQGTRVEFPDTGFTTSIATMLQTRYAFTDRDEDAGLANTSSFDVNRARLIVSGTALNREFTYMLSTDFISAPDSDANFDQSPSVRDAYIDWKPCNDDSGIRMGAFKTAVSRQFNTDQQSMQFADRSAASEYFTLGRQNGLMGYTALADGMITGSAGIFNGESDFEGANASGVDTRHTGVVAVRLNPTGSMNTAEEGDIDWTEELATSFGVTYAYSDKANTVAGSAKHDGSHDMDVDTGSTLVNQSGLINVDANLKYMGFSLHGEYFYRDNDSDFSGDPSGFYVQAGYFFSPKKFELAGRYAYTDCDNGEAVGTCAGNDNVTEASATLNYYFWRHNLKAQLGYDFVQTDSMAGGDVNSNRYIFQLSSYF